MRLARERRTGGRGVGRITAATVVAVMAVGLAGEAASARVVQTIGNKGQLRLRNPVGVALGPSGLIYVLDIGDRASSPVRMTVYSPSGTALRRWHIATESGPIPQMVVDPVGNAWVVASATIDNANLRYSILKYSPTGGLLTATWGAPAIGSSPNDPPRAPAFDGNGNVLVVMGGGTRIDTFDGAGQLLTSWQYVAPGDYRNAINGLTVATSGALYVADRKGIALLDSSGTVVSRIVKAGDRLGEASWARLVAGPAGSVYTVQEHRVQKFGPDGQFLGAVGSDRHAQWLSAAVAGDGSIYVPQWRSGGNGVVLRLAPITAVDVTPPSITIASFSHPPIKTGARAHANRVLARLRYTLSEDSSFRVSLKRRASTRDRRSRYFGRYLHIATLDRALTSAGTHTLVLDWRSFNYERPFPGRYQLALVARDDAGSESAPARVSFSVARP